MAKCWGCCTSKQTFLVPLVLLHLPAPNSTMNCSPVPFSSAFSDVDYGFYSGKAGLRASPLGASGLFQARCQGCDATGSECAAAARPMDGIHLSRWDGCALSLMDTGVLLWCPEVSQGRAHKTAPWDLQPQSQAVTAALKSGNCWGYGSKAPAGH